MNPRDEPPGWLAHPAYTVLLAVVWLLLRESVAPADLLVAAVLGLVIPRLTHRFLGPALRPRIGWTALRLVAVVLRDVVHSNFVVARLVLHPKAPLRPAWVRVALDTQHPTAISLLALIITMTPGTVSCIVDERRREILVHALDCDDPAALAVDMKARYEAPLREIFG